MLGKWSFMDSIVRAFQMKDVDARDVFVDRVRSMLSEGNYKEVSDVNTLFRQ